MVARTVSKQKLAPFVVDSSRMAISTITYISASGTSRLVFSLGELALLDPPPTRQWTILEIAAWRIGKPTTPQPGLAGEVGRHLVVGNDVPSRVLAADLDAADDVRPDKRSQSDRACSLERLRDVFRPVRIRPGPLH